MILFFGFWFGKNLRMMYAESKINSSDKKTETAEPKKPAVEPIKIILQNEKWKAKISVGKPNNAGRYAQAKNAVIILLHSPLSISYSFSP